MNGQEKQPEKRLPSNVDKVATSKSPLRASITADRTVANQLTPEEQMALYEKELKENDWGHQPC